MSGGKTFRRLERIISTIRVSYRIIESRLGHLIIAHEYLVRCVTERPFPSKITTLKQDTHRIIPNHASTQTPCMRP